MEFRINRISKSMLVIINSGLFIKNFINVDFVFCLIYVFVICFVICFVFCLLKLYIVYYSFKFFN